VITVLLKWGMVDKSLLVKQQGLFNKTRIFLKCCLVEEELTAFKKFNKVIFGSSTKECFIAWPKTVGWANFSKQNISITITFLFSLMKII
jgi:hypothetical protein